MGCFAHGSVVALREVWRRRVWKARPAVVVRDEDELLALWTPVGAPMLVADTGSGIPTPAWELVPQRSEQDALRLCVPGSPLMHVAFWRRDVADGWKVDVVRPLRRFAAGFEYLDLELDVRVAVDGSAALVDEDEFLESRRRGVIDELEAAAVRREAEAALDAARRRELPFDDAWKGWTPDPEGVSPTLPAGWDAPADDLPRLR